MGDELIRRRRLIDLQELEFSQLAAQFARTNEYVRTGFATSIDWIRINCHMTGPAARRPRHRGQAYGRAARIDPRDAGG
jgi:hypothetical protein